MSEMFNGLLHHALGRDEYGRPSGHDGTDYRNYYVAGGEALVLCRQAVAQGLMTEHPASDLTGGSPLFRVTEAGKAYIAEHSPTPPDDERHERVTLDEFIDEMKPSKGFKDDLAALWKRHPNEPVTTLLLALLEQYATYEDDEGLEILSELTTKFADHERTIF